MKLLISIPIYNLENAIEITENVMKYTNSIIVLHNNSNTDFSNDTLIKSIDSNIIVNENRLQMDSPHSNSPNSLYDIIVSNIEYTKDIDYDYIIFLTSNTRFIKKGIEEWFESNTNHAGYSIIPSFGFVDDCQINEIRFPWGIDLNICKQIIDFPNYYYANVDGAYMKKDMALEMCNYKINYPFMLIAPQEVIVPSFISNKTTNIGEIITYTDWKNKMIITKEIIDTILNESNTSLSHVFCVKRINMDNIEMRNYIKSL
jgi:hypothetical protein